MTDPTQRFGDRVDDYVRYRPSYPPQVLNLMRAELGLRPEHRVADVGSGTGLLSEHLLDNGNTVYAVEPNRGMREAAERALSGREGFVSVSGSAECTGLPDASVHFVTAGQAFHWFEPTGAATEFARILVPPGWVVLVWNIRRLSSTPFQVAYETFLREWGTDYESVRVSYEVEEDLAEVLGPRGWVVRSFPNHQVLDAEGLRGRVTSSSYVPGPDHPDRKGMLQAIDELFAVFQEEGTVRLDYDTKVYYGRIAADAPRGRRRGGA